MKTPLLALFLRWWRKRQWLVVLVLPVMLVRGARLQLPMWLLLPPLPMLLLSAACRVEPPVSSSLLLVMHYVDQPRP